MGPGNKCRDDSLEMAGVSLPGRGDVNAVASGLQTQLLCEIPWEGSPARDHISLR
jgi:hypothetical protein